MSCNCKLSSPSCEPCAFCSPPGVTCLTTCTPIDPCDEKIDLCCVLYSGPAHECSDITVGQPLCEIVIQVLEALFPPEYCCALTGTLTVITTTTTAAPTTTTSSTSTTTTTTLPPCNCYYLDSEEITHFSYINCNGTFIPDLTVTFNGTQICGSAVEEISGAPGTITAGGLCVQGVCPATTTTTTAAPPVLGFIQNSTSCQKSSEFAIRKTITGLSSPLESWYDVTTNRVWVIDCDDVLGNIYWFNPQTLPASPTIANVTHVPGGPTMNKVHNWFIDTVYRRIYIVGADSNGGLISFDMATEVFTTVLTYGSNVTYQRGTLFVTANFIYVNNSNGSTTTNLIKINRNNLTLPVSSNIPVSANMSPWFALGIQQMIAVGNMIWVSSGGGGNGAYNYPPLGGGDARFGTIGIFDQNFNYQGNIVLPNQSEFCTGYGNCCSNWQSIKLDPVSGNVWAIDWGSNRIHVITPNGTFTSGTVIQTTQTNPLLEDKLDGVNNASANSQCFLATGFFSFTIDPVNNNWYITGSAMNDFRFDTQPRKKMYLIDRNTNTPTKMIPGYDYTNLTQVDDGLTNSLMGCSPGRVFLNGGAWNTDGSITFFNNSVAGQNTGTVIVQDLIQVDLNTNIPIVPNVIVNNLISNPDYIPPYFNDTTCPIVYTLTCPTKSTRFWNSLYWYEFNIIDTVRLNPAIQSIRITALSSTTPVGTPVTLNAPFARNYYSGSFAGLTNTSLSIKIEYLGTVSGNPNTVLATCTI